MHVRRRLLEHFFLQAVINVCSGQCFVQLTLEHILNENNSTICLISLTTKEHWAEQNTSYWRDCVAMFILIPFWLIIMWDCTALKMHLTQKMYMICTWDWQQNLTYVWYVAPSTHKSTLTCCYAPPTIYWLKGTRSLTSVYK